MAVAQPRSAQSVPAHRLHGRLQHVRAAGKPQSIADMIRTACRSGCRLSAVDLTILAFSRSLALSRPFGRSRRGRGRSLPGPDRFAIRAAAWRCRVETNRVKGAAPSHFRGRSRRGLGEKLRALAWVAMAAFFAARARERSGGLRQERRRLQRWLTSFKESR